MHKALYYLHLSIHCSKHTHMYVLGISAYYHDSAACLIKGGEIIAAAQEERFTRIKHDSAFPNQSIIYCINEANIEHNEIDYIVFYEKPFLKFERILETYLSFAPKGFKNFSRSLPIWIKEKLFQKKIILNELNKIFKNKLNLKGKLLFNEHHLSHAASAFYPSPFEKAAILTIDGVGEWSTCSVAIGNRNKITIKKEIHFPHSIGLLYSAFTYFLGFKVNSGEYKLMGLAPFGKPKYVDKIKNNLVKIFDDGSFHLNMKYFDYCTNLKMTNQKFNNLFDQEPRDFGRALNQKDMDIASSAQKVIEEIIIKIVRNIKLENDVDNLCLSGGVALNCVSNSKIVESNIFKNIWIQPASGDAGGCIGAALSVYYLMLDNKRKVFPEVDSMKGALLGPKYYRNEIINDLKESNAIFLEKSENEIINEVAQLLYEGKAIGWMNGRMEFGPRSLGNRSILASPLIKDMQKKLNLKIKFRESFRPFAPTIIEEAKNDWFELNKESPYMLLVGNVKKNKLIINKREEKNIGLGQINYERSVIPAVTHVDNSARIQTVKKDINPKFYKLISKFGEISNCPILVNTSFNIRGEPIVCTAKDAYKCFMGTDLDVLVIDNFILYKKKQPKNNINNYKNKFELD